MFVTNLYQIGDTFANRIMAVSVHERIKQRILKKGRGRIVLVYDFLDFASASTIKKTLSRLAMDEYIIRLGMGVYLYPKHDPEIGILYPSIEEIAAAIAKRDGAKIIPTGTSALQKLGLSTQVPMKAVYLTDGAPRTVNIGKRTIKFKRTTPKKLAIKSTLVQLVVQALAEIGEKNLTPEHISKLHKALKHEAAERIKKDAMLAPSWIARFLFEYLKKRK